MAETTSHRWTDKPLARLALYALGAVMLFVIAPGAGWLVRSAVANEATNVRQDDELARHDAELKEIRDNAKAEHAEVMQAIRDVRTDIKDLKK